MFKTILGTQQNLPTEAWSNIQQILSRYQKWHKQLLFRKNKDFQIADEHIIGKQEKEQIFRCNL